MKVNFTELKAFGEDLKLMREIYNNYKDGEIIDISTDAELSENILNQFKTLEGYYSNDIVEFLDTISVYTGFEFTVVNEPSWGVDIEHGWWEYNTIVYKGHVFLDEINFSSIYTDYNMAYLLEYTLPDGHIEDFCELINDMSDHGFDIPDLRKVTLDDLTDFMKNKDTKVVLNTLSGGYITRNEFIDEAEKYYSLKLEDYLSYSELIYNIGCTIDDSRVIAAAFREYYSKKFQRRKSC